MDRRTIKLIFLIAGTLVFNIIFWQESLGINLLLFTTMLLGFMFYLNPLLITSRAALLVAGGALLNAVANVITNSDASRVAVTGSFIVLSGFAMFPTMRSIITALITGIVNYFSGALTELPKMHLKGMSAANWQRLSKIVRLLIIPSGVVLVFLVIFLMANPVFAGHVEGVLNAIERFITQLFANFQLERVWFIIFGLFIVSGLVYQGYFNLFYKREEQQTDLVIYRSEESNMVRLLGLNDINDEAKAGLIMLAMVNLLALVVNIIDIKGLWFNFQYRPGMDLSALVHSGTYLLIFSILLSMGILLYLFRGNQNFNEYNRWLRYGAYAWVLQNTIMSISVGIRVYYYIHHYGLAYKRIGVCLFLSLVVFGLITLTYKITRKRSGFFLWRINAWAVYALLFGMSWVNWDLMIARHNVSRKFAQEPMQVMDSSSDSFSSSSSRNYHKNIDTDFLLSLSDKSLQALINKPQFISDTIPFQRTTTKQYYEHRIDLFRERKARESWLSWNLAEANTLRELNKYYPPIVAKPKLKQ